MQAPTQEDSLSHNRPETGAIATDIAAREAQVIGEGPRIAAVPDEAIDPEARVLVNTIRAGAGVGPAEIMPEYMRIVIKHPELFRCQLDLGTVLYNGLIPARERELAILRVGWLTQAPYEWGQHVDIAKRTGLTAEEVDRVTLGSSAAGWSQHNAAILRGVEELIADHALSDVTWDCLAKTWDDAQLIEFPMMVGQYVATAYVQNSLRIPMMDGNPGLAHR
jgi:4-carboxymuconolactone decarboxylase